MRYEVEQVLDGGDPSSISPSLYVRRQAKAVILIYVLGQGALWLKRYQDKDHGANQDFSASLKYDQTYTSAALIETGIGEIAFQSGDLKGQHKKQASFSRRGAA